ncbi:MAG: methyltransferase domain-containing protein [SAR324 cluster bacterium]|nr:methyltransferase domain-containing protein [SAR324 cluster bacterium]
MTAGWDPKQYLTFDNHRLRPALELLMRIPHDAPAQVVDLGCGPGNVTPYLRERWPGAVITGVDNSGEMLTTARKSGVDATWCEADLVTWTPEAPVDVMYTNAALQWAEDHEALFPRLMSMLAPGGVLAVQMPRNFGQPSHTTMKVAAAQGPWAAKLARVERRAPVAEPDFYYGLLAPLSEKLDIWETRYVQVLTGENPVAEYTKGSWLKPMLDALEEPERSGFEAAYRKLVLAAYPPREDGATLFPFTRLFMVAVN